MADDFNWQCPHCERHVTIGGSRISAGMHQLRIANADGLKILATRFIVCPNEKCRKITLEADLWAANEMVDRLVYDRTVSPRKWRLIPQAKGRNLPDYVPAAIRNDYEEACAIRDRSPKASATLARRALQGIIRDYWGAKPGRLVDEIGQVKDKIDPTTWEAIDSVRKVGNIGAHMEHDINLIVDVDPNEAELLTGLIETLIDDTYVARHKRKEQAAAIIALANKKKDEKGGG